MEMASGTCVDWSVVEMREVSTASNTPTYAHVMAKVHMSSVCRRSTAPSSMAYPKTACTMPMSVRKSIGGVKQ